MNWSSLIGPAVVAAVIASIVSVIGFLINRATVRGMHTERLAFDKEQAERRATAEIAMAERKFTYDVGVTEARIKADVALAEKRLSLDHELDIRKRRAVFAEEVLADFYQARDIIQAARSPGSFGNEGETRPTAAWETEEDTRKMNAYYATAERLDKKAEFFAQLHARRYRVLALFGSEGKQPFDEIFKLRHEIIVAVQMLVWTHENRTEGSLPANRRAWEQIIWDTQSEDDTIATRLDRTIEAIETICRPALQAVVQ